MRHGLWAAGSDPGGPAGCSKPSSRCWATIVGGALSCGRREPMRAKDIHAAVAALVGEPVSWGSVKSALAANVSSSSACLVRVARGRYVLAETRHQGLALA